VLTKMSLNVASGQFPKEENISHLRFRLQTSQICFKLDKMISIFSRFARVETVGSVQVKIIDRKISFVDRLGGKFLRFFLEHCQSVLREAMLMIIKFLDSPKFDNKTAIVRFEIRENLEQFCY
jgi:hypothetical protein